VKILKRYDLTEELSSFVDDNDYKDGEEILIQLDGREICKAVVVRDGDDIDFKVIALR
jgi:hypothetical protein